MQKPLHNIYGMLRRIEMLCRLFDTAVCIGDSNIIPAVDVDLLNFWLTEILSQDRILCHFAIKFVGKFAERIAINHISRIVHILFNILFQLVTLISVGKCCRIGF